MKMTCDCSLYLVTDSTGLEEKDFLHKVREACEGGITLLQLREKEKTTREYIQLAVKVKEITDRFGIPLIIDDRIDVAMAIDAAGVHVGQSDMPVDKARKLMGSEKIIGATTKTIPQAQEAQSMGADYLGVGAIYPTTTKVKTVLTEVSTLKAICEEVHIPVVAIGGLNEENCDVLAHTGISGMAVVSAIMKACDTREATKSLKIKIDQLKG